MMMRSIHNMVYVEAQYPNIAIAVVDMQVAETVDLTCQNPGS